MRKDGINLTKIMTDLGRRRKSRPKTRKSLRKSRRKSLKNFNIKKVIKDLGKSRSYHKVKSQLLKNKSKTKPKTKTLTLVSLTSNDKPVLKSFSSLLSSPFNSKRTKPSIFKNTNAFFTGLPSVSRINFTSDDDEEQKEQKEREDEIIDLFNELPNVDGKRRRSQQKRRRRRKSRY